MYTSSFTVQEGKVIVHLTKNLMKTLGICICTCIQCTQSSYPIKSQILLCILTSLKFGMSQILLCIFLSLKLGMSFNMSRIQKSKTFFSVNHCILHALTSFMA